MVLFLHNRYRTTGGEERVVNELLTLVRERLEEPAELLERDSAGLGRARAASGLLRGGLAPSDVSNAVRMTGARVVHAHNLNPAFGWRALAAARAEGARVVLHLHQYRLVCATGVCFTQGRECTRCHGRNTLPGLIHGCRGNRSEGFAYAASLALWQRRLADQADAVIVPSAFARERLRELGAPLDFERVHVLPPPVTLPPGAGAASATTPPLSNAAMDAHRAGRGDASPIGVGSSSGNGAYALVVSRLAPEKGVDVAIDACRIAGVPLVIAGDGPELEALRVHAGDGDVRFDGRVDDDQLASLRSAAALAVVPSRSAETFGMAAAEAMAVALPVVASRVGALPELLEESALVEPGNVTQLAEAIRRLWRDASAGRRGQELIRARCAPQVVADGLRAVYGSDPAIARRA